MANNRVQVKRTSVAGRTPNTTNAGNLQYIAAGELALNMTDQVLVTSDGTNLIYVGANQADQRITNTLTLDNNKPIRFKTGNTSAVAYFIQQNDDNFVFYTTNTVYGARPVFSIFANSDTSPFSFGVPVSFTGANVNFNTTRVYANGTSGTAGQVLTSNGTATYWSSAGAATVNVDAQYTWTNTQTFSANISFGNNIGFATAAGIYFNGIADANWRLGRNTGTTTKFFYTGNTIDIIAAGSSLEGIAFGQPGANTYLETGYNGTYTRLPVYIGNSTQNVVATNLTILFQTNTTVNSTHTASLLQIANSTSTANLTALDLKIGATTVVNSTQITATLHVGNVSGSYANITGQVNTATLYAATSANIASAVQANATGVWTTGTVNAATHAVGTAFTANSTVVNAVSYYSGTLLVANTTVINATHLAGSTWAAPQILGGTTANGASLTYANVSGQVNTATLYATTSANIASIVQANSLGVHVGANVVANTTALKVGNTTLTTTNAVFGGTIGANGGIGSAGQVLTSGGAGNVYWTTPQIGDITGVTAGNGLTGGGTSGDVTLNVVAANGITVAADSVSVTEGVGLAVNTTGVHVKANTGIVANTTGTFVNATYIGTLTANNSTYFGGYTWGSPAVIGGTAANGASFTYANVSGQVNTATIYATTSANVASIVQANSLGVHVGANVVANTTTLKVGNTTLTTTNAVFGGTIAANGGIGTAKQVLISGAAANAYWSTLDLSYIPDAVFKKSVKAATTADLGAASATTTTITGPLAVLPAQDGITLVVGDRLLVKNQTAAAQNGIYEVTVVGVAGTTAWVLTRVADADTVSELAGGIVNVDDGTLNGAKLFENNLKTTGTLGTTAVNWYQIIDQSGGTLFGNVVMGTGSTGIYPTSNTVGNALGNTTARWVLVANSGDFSTTLAAGNTTVTGFVNATSSVNALSHTVGTAFTANATVVNAVSYYSGTLLVANNTVINATHIAGFTLAAPSVIGSGTANGASLTYANVSGQVNTATLYATTSANIASIVQANSLGVHVGANVVANTTTLKVGNTTVTTTNAIFGGTIAANGGIGTAKQVLTSGGAANSSWATLDMSYIPDAAFKKSVRAATTADLAAASATTTTITGTLVAFPAQDGITLVVGNRLLVKNQTAAAQNGIYEVTVVGSAGVTAWVLTRTADADTSAEIAGAFVSVDEGTVNGGKVYDNDFKTTDTLGTTAMSWNRNVDDGGATFLGNVVMGTGSTGIYPTSNTVGNALGNTTARWVLVANSGNFSTTLAAGNTTVTGFVNATSSVNAASLTVGTSTIANTLGVYTGIVNAATHSVGTAFTANSTVVNAVSYYSGTLLVANTTVINATHIAGFTLAAPSILGSGTANGASLTYANVSGQVNTATLYATTSANIASTVQANTLGLFSTLVANAQNFTAGAGFGAATVGATVNSGTIGISSNTIVNSSVTASLVQVANATGNVQHTATSILAQTNTTVNSTHTASLLQVSNSTSTANLTALDLKIGATTVVNSTQVTATLHVGNVSGSYANITGQVNTATLYAATSANIASIVQANSLGVHVGANVVANTSTLRVGNTTVTTTNAIFGGTIAANGGIGTAGQVLTSGAAGNVYWSTVASGSTNVNATYSWTNVHSFSNAVYLATTAGSNVGIGTSTPAYKLQVNGSFAAVTKSFVIDHPTKTDMKLRYGSLEGPENGVYVRGKIEGMSIIELPEYWWNLVDENSITVNLTPYGRSQDIWVQSISTHFIHLNQPADCFFTVFAERKDVDKLVVEF